MVFVFVSGHDFSRVEKPQKKKGLQPLSAQRDARSASTVEAPAFKPGKSRRFKNRGFSPGSQNHAGAPSEPVLLGWA